MEQTKETTKKASLNQFLQRYENRDITKPFDLNGTIFYFNPEEFIEPCFDSNYFPTEDMISNKNIVLQTFQAKKIVLEPVFFMNLNIFNIQENYTGTQSEFFMGKVLKSHEKATYQPGCYIFFQKKNIFDVINAY